MCGGIAKLKCTKMNFLTSVQMDQTQDKKNLAIICSRDNNIVFKRLILTYITMKGNWNKMSFIKISSSL